MGIHDGIDPPMLLAAMPQVRDPIFHRSVVLLLHHDDEGSFGLIINRPTELLVTDILESMEIEWAGSREALAYFGGPVRPQLGTVLCSAPSDAQGLSAAAEIWPGVATTQHFGDLAVLAKDPPPHLRLVLGYAGWGEEQLMKEILRNDWLTAPVQDELIFHSQPADAWERTLQSVGVNPATLPSWTPSGNGSAN